MNMKIGIFDSGVGGLTILHAVRKFLPHYDYLYYGDTAHVPYGDRAESEIYELTKKGVEYLFERDCALVVLACNTASAETARRLQQEFLPKYYPDRKILGVIIPTLEAIIDSGYESAILIATKRTIDSQKYTTELKKLETTVVLQTNAAPQLVPMIESGKLKEAAAELERCIDRLSREGSLVVLGCTHYSVLRNYISDECKAKHTIMYQTDIIPIKLSEYLVRHYEIESRLSRGGSETLHFTGSTPNIRIFV